LKKSIILVTALVLTWTMLGAEGLTLYMGKTSAKARYYGVSIGGDIWDFLQLQFDVMKYFREDPTLHSEDPALNRGNWLGASFNIVLKLPLHLIPYMDRFEYIQPYLLSGYGYGLESLAAEYIDQEDANGNSGLFSRLRPYRVLGAGLVIMISPMFGLKIDYRTFNLSEQKDIGLPGRSFDRISIGICFGPYKTSITKGKS
jgi:hypothetical protein